MTPDPILEEVRRIKEAHAAKYGFDVQKMFAAIKKEEQESGCKVILPAKAGGRTRPVPAASPSWYHRVMGTDSPLATVSTSPPPTPAKMTYEEFMEWHPGYGLAEWVDGEGLVMAPPATNHQLIAGFVYRCLSYYVESRSLGVVFYAPVQMRLPRSGREPDVLFVATEHAARIEGRYINGPADLAIEVVSPDSRKRDRIDKFREYAEAGVREYWVLDGAKKQALFYSLGTDGAYHALPVDDNGVFHSEVLTGFWLRVDWLWQEPLPALPTVLKEWGLI
jgi:Uma2 family endonuclease